MRAARRLPGSSLSPHCALQVPPPANTSLPPALRRPPIQQEASGRSLGQSSGTQVLPGRGASCSLGPWHCRVAPGLPSRPWLFARLCPVWRLGLDSVHLPGPNLHFSLSRSPHGQPRQQRPPKPCPPECYSWGGGGRLNSCNTPRLAGGSFCPAPLVTPPFPPAPSTDRASGLFFSSSKDDSPLQTRGARAAAGFRHAPARVLSARALQNMIRPILHV